MKSFKEWFTTSKFDRVCQLAEIMAKENNTIALTKALCEFAQYVYEQSAIENMEVKLVQPDTIDAGYYERDGRAMLKIPKIPIEQIVAEMFNENIYPQLISIEDEIEEVNKVRAEETLALAKRVDSLALAVRALSNAYVQSESKKEKKELFRRKTK